MKTMKSVVEFFILLRSGEGQAHSMGFTCSHGLCKDNISRLHFSVLVNAIKQLLEYSN